MMVHGTVERSVGASFAVGDGGFVLGGRGCGGGNL